MGERPGFSCPQIENPGSAASTAVIATQDLNKVLHRDGRFVTVQAGITMTELIDWANANDLTLPLGTVPSYLDLTIGGLLATGGHAQGPKSASNVVTVTNR
jgi:FAD/FMN-containing dehydrogenase